jgi:hypothetical protein
MRLDAERRSEIARLHGGWMSFPTRPRPGAGFTVSNRRQRAVQTNILAWLTPIAIILVMGIFRVVCTNGLIVSRGAFPAYCVPHRGNVVDEVIAGALKMSEQFDTLAAQVERTERRRMLKHEQLRFAEAALALRYPEPAGAGMQPSQLLTCRRAEDLGDNLWVLLNRIQLCSARHNWFYVER